MHIITIDYTSFYIYKIDWFRIKTFRYNKLFQMLTHATTKSGRGVPSKLYRSFTNKKYQNHEMLKIESETREKKLLRFIMIHYIICP